MKTEKKYVITESQLKTVIKDVIKEQGLYGNTSDVVDYDLPEYLIGCNNFKRLRINE